MTGVHMFERKPCPGRTHGIAPAKQPAYRLKQLGVQMSRQEIAVFWFVLLAPPGSFPRLGPEGAHRGVLLLLPATGDPESHGDRPKPVREDQPVQGACCALGGESTERPASSSSSSGRYQVVRWP